MFIISIFVYLETTGLPGLFCFFKATITKSIKLFRINSDKFEFPLNIRIPSTDALIYRQVFIKQEYTFNVKYTPKVIVDAGAYIGLASIFFANKFPEAKIISIEPEKGNFELLKQNSEYYDNIIPIQAAIWDKNGEINLIDPGYGHWGFKTEEDDALKKKSGKYCYKVKSITVDKIMKDYKLDKIDILKIDIEGAEKEVFCNTTSWISKVDTLIIELHEHIKPGCNESFYNGSKGFNNSWKKGENIFLSRGNS